MSGKKGTANDNGGGADPEGFTLYRNGRGGRGGRGSIGARTGGQGRTGGRGRRSGRALEDKNRNKNQFNYLNGEAYDAEDDDDDDEEENEFENEEDLATAGKDNTSAQGGTKAATEEGGKLTTNDDEMKQFVDALYGADFIPDSAFLLKTANEGREDTFANKMVGVVTEITKKRQLSIDDTGYTNSEKSEGKDTAGADDQNDTANKEGSIATQRGAKGHIPVKATVQDEDNHFDAMEKVAKEIKEATKKTPSTDEASNKSGEATATHKR
jgi:hypothetical protein